MSRKQDREEDEKRERQAFIEQQRFYRELIDQEFDRNYASPSEEVPKKDNHVVDCPNVAIYGVSERDKAGEQAAGREEYPPVPDEGLPGEEGAAGRGKDRIGPGSDFERYKLDDRVSEQEKMGVIVESDRERVRILAQTNCERHVQKINEEKVINLEKDINTLKSETNAVSLVNTNMSKVKRLNEDTHRAYVVAEVIPSISRIT